jgi:predicted small lipoprotein YifL
MRKLVCLLFMTCAVSACGKKGPLIYPDMLVPAAPSSVAARQSGDAVKLSFVLPAKDLAGRNLTGLAVVSILKLDEPAGVAPVCNSCTTDYALFRKLNLDLLPPDAQRYGNLLVVLDGKIQAGRSHAYRVSVTTKGGQEGALSVTASVAPVAAPFPPVLQAISHPTEIQLEFVGLPPTEGAIAGYNVYRTLKGEPFPLLPLNEVPLVGPRYVDAGLERGTAYSYGIRTVIRLLSGGVVESLLSNEAEGMLKDDE